MKHINSTLTVHTDGGSRGNPGLAAYGFVIHDAENNLVVEIGKQIGINTNNFAEYMAVISALRWIEENTSPFPSNINIYLDSQLIERQIKGEYKIKQETLRSLFFTVQQVMEKLGSHITFTHVPRAENKAADAMVNLALDSKA